VGTTCHLVLCGYCTLLESLILWEVLTWTTNWLCGKDWNHLSCCQPFIQLCGSYWLDLASIASCVIDSYPVFFLIVLNLCWIHVGFVWVVDMLQLHHVYEATSQQSGMYSALRQASPRVLQSKCSLSDRRIIGKNSVSENQIQTLHKLGIFLRITHRGCKEASCCTGCKWCRPLPEG